MLLIQRVFTLHKLTMFVTQVIDAQTRDVTLIINGVQESHLTQYDLVAENTMGKSTQTILVEKGRFCEHNVQETLMIRTLWANSKLMLKAKLESSDTFKGVS